MKVQVFVVLVLSIYFANGFQDIRDKACRDATVGDRGPTLLQDTLLIEKIATLSRERIPERTVHARGTSVKGIFTVTQHQRDYTSAALFNTTGKVTPVIARFSSSTLGAGSPEWIRDPRGFAVKFYTEEGNYDITGLNFPLYFIRDPIRFPEMVRAFKPNPVSGSLEIWRALDYFSHVPESTNMFSWLFDDAGIVKNYQHMDGWSVHPFIFTNNKNQGTLVRFKWDCVQGEEFLLDGDVFDQKLSYMQYSIDMYNDIQAGKYPKWKLLVQRLPLNPDLGQLGFDPLDATKDWPKSKVPFEEIGEMELNEWPSNQYTENELLSFSPGHLVPGIVASDDKMLQGRLFAYPDAARYRLGVNAEMIPVNRARCPFSRNDFNGPFIDGHMNIMEYSSQINYFPSRANNMVENPNVIENVQYTCNGPKTREDIGNVGDDYDHARVRYNRFDEERKARFAGRWAAALTAKRMDESFGTTIKEVWLSRLALISQDLRTKVVSLINGVGSRKRNETGSDFEEFRQNFYANAGFQ